MSAGESRPLINSDREQSYSLWLNVWRNRGQTDSLLRTQEGCCDYSCAEEWVNYQRKYPDMDVEWMAYGGRSSRCYCTFIFGGAGLLIALSSSVGFFVINSDICVGSEWLGQYGIFPLCYASIFTITSIFQRCYDTAKRNNKYFCLDDINLSFALTSLTISVVNVIVGRILMKKNNC